MDIDVTMLLSEAGENSEAAEQLFQAVYHDLQVIAESQMRGERKDHTLQATALVSEAYLRLVGGAEVSFNDRKHFFRVAAESMRRILIDHARARVAEKRGGGRDRRPLLEADGMVDLDPERLLVLDEALEKLGTEDPRAAELVRLRYFGGLSLDAAAGMMDISERTANRDWVFARARLSELMGADG